MFYVSSKNNGLLGVTDSKDGVEEFYTSAELKNIATSLNLDIWGFLDENNIFEVDINKFLNIIKNCTLLYENLELGNTVMVSMANSNNFYNLAGKTPKL